MTKERREEIKKVAVDLYQSYGYGFNEIVKAFRDNDGWGLNLDERRYLQRVMKNKGISRGK